MELRATRAHIWLALDLYAEDRRAYPTDEVLWDGTLLWEAILPYLPTAMISVAEDLRRKPEWTDVTTNRLTSTPGLRVATVSRDASTTDGASRALVQFEEVFPGDPSR